MPDLLPSTKNIIYTCITFFNMASRNLPVVLHKFNSPGYKKTGTFQSLSFLQSCLYIKDTQTKWNGPGYAGKRFAYPYYTISPIHSARKLLRFWRNSKPALREIGQYDRFCPDLQYNLRFFCTLTQEISAVFHNCTGSELYKILYPCLRNLAGRSFCRVKPYKTKRTG